MCQKMGLYSHSPIHTCSFSCLWYYFKRVWIIPQNCRVIDYPRLHLLCAFHELSELKRGGEKGASQHFQMNEYVWNQHCNLYSFVRISVMLKWRGISSAKPFYFPFPHHGSFPIFLERESNVFYFLRQVESKQTPSCRRTLLRQKEVGVWELLMPHSLREGATTHGLKS